MSFTICVSLCLLVLSLSLASPALAQSQSNDLAAALVRAESDEEQERLLAQKKDMMNGALSVALKEFVDYFDICHKSYEAN